MLSKTNLSIKAHKIRCPFKNASLFATYDQDGDDILIAALSDFSAHQRASSININNRTQVQPMNRKRAAKSIEVVNTLNQPYVNLPGIRV